MITSQSTTTTAENTARTMFRTAGYQTVKVPSTARHDREFAALVFTDPRGTAAALNLITRPGSHVEVQRIHTTKTATRIYLQWTR